MARAPVLRRALTTCRDTSGRYPPRVKRPSPTAAFATWRERWGAIAPLLLAEFIVWLGFGGLLPVLPLYFVDQGVDLRTLGIVVAAWPAARLVGEPIFGWIADRTARVPLMVVGLVLAGIFTILPLIVTGSVAFIALRAIVGLATAIYDPAARGYVTDATPPERRGEAFGLYGAAQMGGLLLGPAIGAFGADRLGGIGFAFVFAGLAAALAAIPIARLGREEGPRTHAAPVLDATEFPPDSPSISRRAAADVAADRGLAVAPGAPGRLLNGIFGAAGTMGFIVASLVAGALAVESILYPFYVFSGVMAASLLIGLLVGGRRLQGQVRDRVAEPQVASGEPTVG